MSAPLKMQDRVRVVSSSSAKLFPGRWARFPTANEIGTVIDFDGALVVVENADQNGTIWWMASFPPTDLEFIGPSPL